MHIPIKLIVGLGNPGPEYVATRHNVGSEFILQLAQNHSTTLTPESKFFGLCGRCFIGSSDIRLINPTTFMNLSGKAIAAISQFYKIPPESILIVHDELSLPPGTARLKIGGGHGGHNGLKDTIKSLGDNKNFARLRIGIGHPGDAKKVTGYVLGKPTNHEKKNITNSIIDALNIIPLIIEGEWNNAMKQLHTPE